MEDGVWLRIPQVHMLSLPGLAAWCWQLCHWLSHQDALGKKINMLFASLKWGHTRWKVSLCGLYIAADALLWVPASAFSPVKSDVGVSWWRRIPFCAVCINYYYSLALMASVICKTDLWQPRLILTPEAYCVPQFPFLQKSVWFRPHVSSMHNHPTCSLLYHPSHRLTSIPALNSP